MIRRRVLLALAVCMLTACATAPRVELTQTRTSRFEYDATGLLTKEIVEPDVSDLCLVKVYERDAWGNVSRTTLRNCDGSSGEAPPPAPGSPAIFAARASSAVYDSRGQFAVTLTNALNQSETRSYDARFGGATSIIGPNQLPTTAVFDEFGRKTSEQPPVGAATTWQYEDCPSGCAYRYRIIESNGRTTPDVRREFDRLDRELAHEVSRLDGTAWARQEQRFDARGRQTATTRRFAAGDLAARDLVTTTVEYDLLNRPVRATAPEGRITVYAYAGLQTSVTDPRSNVRTTRRNLAGLVEWNMVMGGTTVTYAYDAFENLVTTDAGGVASAAAFDLRGRKIQMSDADTGSWTYVYDALSQLLQQTNANQQTTTMSYDLLGRLLQRTEPDLVSTWAYDAVQPECTGGKPVGKPVRAQTSAGYVRIECYDDFGRPAQSRTTQGGETFVTTTEYDSLSRPGRLTYPTGFQLDRIYLNGYLQQLTDVTNGGQLWRLDTLDANAQVTRETAGTVTQTDRTYDYAGRVRTIVAGGGAVLNLGLGYDGADNVTSRSWTIDGIARSETFELDALNRVTTVTGSGGPPAKSYGYDASGNITSKSDLGTYTYAPGTHRLQSITGTVNGVPNPSFAHDANGNQITGAGVTIGWTSFDRPATVQKAGAPSLAFTYGPEHQRIRLDDGAVVTVYVGAYERDTAGGSVTHKHYIAAGAALIAVYTTASGAAGGTLRYLHSDHLGSVGTVTAADGAVVERYGYDAWGLRRNTDGTDAVITAASVDRGYTGHEMLDAQRLVHMNARLYDPQLGRFVSADAIVPDATTPVGFNRYAYVYNNPLTLIDPSGMKPFWRKESFRKYALPVIAVAVAWAAIEFLPALLESLAPALGAGGELAVLGHTTVGAAGGFGSGLVASGGDIKSAAQGALTGGVFGFVGGLFEPGTLGSYAGHAAAGCGSAALQGGNCLRGAAAQVASKFVTVKAVQGGVNGVAGLVVATVAGGTASAITGGKFGNGAYTAAFGYLFNQLAREARSKDMPISESERELAASGDVEGFWAARHTRGDPIGDVGLMSLHPSGGLIDALFGGVSVNDRLEAFSRVYVGKSADMAAIRRDLVTAHVAAVDADRQGTLGLLSPGQVYDYHRDVFARYGLPATTFGGSPFIGARWEAYATRMLWCWRCDR